jgi:hypothetical protein
VKNLINRLFGWGVWRRYVIIGAPLTGVVEWRKRGWRYNARVLTPIEGRGALYFLRLRSETVAGTALGDDEARAFVDADLAKGLPL